MFMRYVFDVQQIFSEVDFERLENGKRPLRFFNVQLTLNNRNGEKMNQIWFYVLCV